MALSPFQPVRTRFATILLAIKAQVIARAVVPASQIQIVARDDPPNTKAQKLVYLRVRRHTVMQDQVESAGRLDTRLVRQLDVYISNNVSLDPINSDETWLTDAARGVYDLEEDVVNALQDFTPLDVFGNAMTVQDIRLLTGAQADKDMQRQLLGWGRANSTWEIVYMPPLSLVDILPSTMNAATAGVAYTQNFTQTGAQGMTVIGIAAWTVTNAPPGLTVNSTSGTISGTPTTAGRYTLVLTCADTVSGLAGWHRYVVQVSIGITPTTLPGGTHAVPYTQTLTAVGGSGAITWSIQLNSGGSGGPLPAGLAINSATGTISGTPTTAGTYAFTAQAVDSKGTSGAQAYSLVIA